MPIATADPDSAANSTRRDVLVIALATIAVLVPFLGKPLHVDDPLFVWTARHIVTDPTNFYGYEINWTMIASPMDRVTQNPPGACYWLAIVGAIAGWSELALHIGMLPVAMAATLGTYAVARLLTGHARWAALITWCMPVFVVSATTLMCDVMMMALWCWAVFCWLLGVRREQPWLLLAGAALVLLAGLTKYFGVALVPLLLVYTACQRRPKLFVWALLAMILPVAGFYGYEVLTARLYGKGLLSEASGYASMLQAQQTAEGRNFLKKAMNTVVYPGGCVLTLAFLTPLLGGRKWLSAIGLIWTVFNLLAVMFLVPQPRPEWIVSYHVQVALFSLAGIVLLALVAGELYQRRDADALLLALWIVGTLFFTTFVNWTANGRSVLPLVPAVGIVAVRRLEALGWFHVNLPLPRWRPWALPAALAVGMALALIVTWSDYGHAVADRDAARMFARRYADDTKRFWYSSHSGFHYYLQEAGIFPLDIDHSLMRAGDHYIQPMYGTGQSLENDLIEPLRFVDFQGAPLGSTHSYIAGAGFYAQIQGPLPFSLVPAPTMSYFIFEVKRDVDFAAQAREAGTVAP